DGDASLAEAKAIARPWAVEQADDLEVVLVEPADEDALCARGDGAEAAERERLLLIELGDDAHRELGHVARLALAEDELDVRADLRGGAEGPGPAQDPVARVVGRERLAVPAAD